MLELDEERTAKYLWERNPDWWGKSRLNLRAAWTRDLRRGPLGFRTVELQDFFVAMLIVGISCVNAAVPIAAWVRARDGRFLLLAGANSVLAVVGAIWAWGVLPVSPPAFAAPQFPILVLVLLVALLLLTATLWPRRT